MPPPTVHSGENPACHVRHASFTSLATPTSPLPALTKKILIAHSNPKAKRTLTLLLADAGFDVRAAAKASIPHVAPLFFAFRIMVGAGVLMLLCAKMLHSLFG